MCAEKGVTREAIPRRIELTWDERWRHTSSSLILNTLILRIRQKGLRVAACPRQRVPARVGRTHVGSMDNPIESINQHQHEGSESWDIMRWETMKQEKMNTKQRGEKRVQSAYVSPVCGR